MSDSKAPLSPQPRSSSTKSMMAGPLVDVEPIPDDPSPEALELAVSTKGAGDKKNSMDEESMPLMPPPAFSKYVADCYYDGSRNIVSHDPHLNEDGEALCRFILENSTLPPSMLVKCKGSHTEWRTRQVTRYENGKNVTSTENYSENVIDFDFTIDVSPHILNGATVWIAGDKDAVNRGRRSPEVDAPHEVKIDGRGVGDDLEGAADGPVPAYHKWRRRATAAEKEATKHWREQRQYYGLAPWVLIKGQMRGMEAAVDTEIEGYRDNLAYSTNDPTDRERDWYDDTNVGYPTKNLRDWADEYCASKRWLKEFNFEKVVHGWNMGALQEAIEATVRDNYAHQSSVEVKIVFEADTISVRADNWFSRMLSQGWVKIILWITLIYPLFIWPFWKFSSRGGGSWEVAGSAFALCRWVPVTDAQPEETLEEYTARTEKVASSSTGPMPSKRLLKQTPRGIYQLIGTREGEWFQEWEDSIGSLVRQRYQSSEPLLAPFGGERTNGIGLSGYYPVYTETPGRRLRF